MAPPFILSAVIALALSAVSVAAGYIEAGSSDAVSYLNAHNSVRAAYNAEPLTWSNELSFLAYQWAGACNFEHTWGSMGAYGENIAAGTGSFSIVDAVGMFTQGVADFDPYDPSYSDFTQVVWQSTTELGCGYASCKGIFDETAIMHVCFYNPSGNIIGELL
ncbi:PR-1-like protein [Coniophora puteana RWD-64-598 SS2]|uniref:PR-1-like protein n=1 Tax=Coniophora puteana (strain RWD-64-598) TaxID=741705 RepID=A0A5M3MTB6_CONPW|nr:PR-1-like protein [Coniophora puteana RWD-64-598 SS2]EIW82287.1 PR-1-like protein [Coniophora puteana RWD-64-598 SS2]